MVTSLAHTPAIYGLIIKLISLTHLVEVKVVKVPDAWVTFVGIIRGGRVGEGILPGRNQLE